MKKYSNPEIYFTFFKAEEHITMSYTFDTEGIEDNGAVIDLG